MSIVSEINRIITAKSDIKNAIIQKGGTISDETIDNYAEAVLSIPSGKELPEIKDTDPLTFVCIYDYNKDDCYLSLGKAKGDTFYNKNFYYNLNDSGWVRYTEDDKIYVKYGDKVQFKATDTNPLSYLELTSVNSYRSFKTVGIFKCGGNIMSLLNNIKDLNSGFAAYFSNLFYNCCITSAPILPSTTLSQYCYYGMFSGCTSLTTAPELPATTLSQYCYNSMFRGCTSLTTAPELPATTLKNNCYNSMFRGCTSLTTAPELPATTLTNNCYNSMFSGCNSLTTAPELPATTLENGCYDSMFSDCNSLTTAPELPATTLADNCYQYMFYRCTSLTTAPELPATTLKNNCYKYMFRDCSKLNYIKALFTTTPGSSYTGNWVSGVASEGTFVKNPNATWTTRGANGVPNNWTIINAEA